MRHLSREEQCKLRDAIKKFPQQLYTDDIYHDLNKLKSCELIDIFNARQTDISDMEVRECENVRALMCFYKAPEQLVHYERNLAYLSASILIAYNQLIDIMRIMCLRSVAVDIMPRGIPRD
jgi:hypothetical protein